MSQILLASASFDLLPVQVWTAKVDGSLDFVNSFVSEYFGIDRQRLLDQGWKDVCHPFDLIVATEKWRHSLATGEPYEVNFRLLRGVDRQFRWHLGRAWPHRSEAGGISAWIGCNTDVDTLKREQEVSAASAVQSRSELERLQAERRTDR